MKEELKKLKKSGKLKEIAKAAGAGGIKNAVSDETKDKIVSGVKKVAQKVSEVGKSTVGSMAKDLLNKKKENKIKQNQKTADEKRKNDLETKSISQLMDEAETRWKKDFGRGYTDAEKQGAYEEITTGKKYKDISPITSKGNFNRNTSKDNWGNTGLTQDDVDRIRKQKKKK